MPLHAPRLAQRTDKCWPPADPTLVREVDVEAKKPQKVLRRVGRQGGHRDNALTDGNSELVPRDDREGSPRAWGRRIRTSMNIPGRHHDGHHIRCGFGGACPPTWVVESVALGDESGQEEFVPLAFCLDRGQALDQLC